MAGDIGGAERLLVDLASRPELTGADHEVALITPNRALADYFSRAGLRVHDRGPARENPLAYLWRSLGPSDLAWLARLLEQTRAQVLHTHTFASHVLGTRAARRTLRPQLRTEHHTMHYFDPSCGMFTRWAAARTDRLVAVSEYVARVVAQTAPSLAARLTVVRNGVDTSYWSQGETAPVVAENSPGEFRIGLVCRLVAWKRVELAIEAAALAGVDLVVVGDGEERGRLEALARRLQARVSFVGYAPDPRPHLRACDLTVSASRDEPLGLSVLESLAMERPVVAIAGGGIPEIVQDGVTGWLVGEATAQALAGAFCAARSERERLGEMGARARSFVLEQASVERMCEGYAAVYRELGA